MSKRLEHVEAAKAEASRLGANIQFYRNHGHFIAIIYLGDKHRKISLSVSPSRLCNYNVIADVRRAVREMQK